jgi:hypothetical protein
MVRIGNETHVIDDKKVIRSAISFIYPNFYKAVAESDEVIAFKLPDSIKTCWINN